MDAGRLGDNVGTTQGAGGIADAGRGYAGYIVGSVRDTGLRTRAGCFADMMRHCAGTAWVGYVTNAGMDADGVTDACRSAGWYENAWGDAD